MKMIETALFDKWYDDLIHKYGHEHPVVIQFGKLAAEYDKTNWNRTYLKILYQDLMKSEIS